MPKRWTPTEEAALYQESQRHSIDELAHRYGVTPKSVAVKLQKLRQAMRKTGVQDVLAIPRQRASVGGEAKRWTPEEEVELLQLHNQGWKTEKLANHFGVSQKAVSVKLLKVKKKGVAELPEVSSQSISQATVTISHRPEPERFVPPKPIVKPQPVAVKPSPVAPPVKPMPKPAPPIRQHSPHSKHVEGEANTQFKVWNGTEWVAIKVPKKIIHV